MAYAKQAGLETPFEQIKFYETKKRDALVDMVFLRDLPGYNKSLTKQAALEILVLSETLPLLTPAQRRRIRSKQDHARTLRDRKGRKLMARLQRRRRSWR